ncbi:MAG: D-hexose-6-phosphate mutarotase [Intrasporangiaceae bacterium]|nr:D-hexose-6-phosphate mutarotase [Intrasporangiaceae bacterium]
MERRIDLPTCTGAVTDTGATVIAWQPTGYAPVLFLSSAAVLAPGSAVRGGVPVCFPWFGPGRQPGAPFSHGFARTASWDHSSDHIGEGGEQRLTYSLCRDDVSDPYWPYDYTADVGVQFGSQLTVSLTVTNLDTEIVSYEAALHSYLAVGSIHDTRVEGLDGAEYVDKAAGGMRRRQEGSLTFTGETDNVYAWAGPVTVVDAAGGRHIDVRSSGASNIIVWNPWREKAARLADLGEGEWERFVCVEAGRVLDGAVRLGEGESHTLTTTISVR